jgi:hypothetical protein
MKCVDLRKTRGKGKGGGAGGRAEYQEKDSCLTWTLLHGYRYSFATLHACSSLQAGRVVAAPRSFRCIWRGFFELIALRHGFQTSLRSYVAHGVHILYHIACFVK